MFRLKTRFNITIVGIVLFFGIISVFSVYYYTQYHLISIEKNNLNFDINDISLFIEQTMEVSKEVTETIALQDDIIDYLQSDSINFQDEYILRELSNFNTGGKYSAIYLMLPNGITVASTDPSFVGQDYSFRRYFDEAIKGKSFTDSALGVKSGKLGYYFSYPVKANDGSILGIVVTKLDPAVINQDHSIVNYQDKYNIMIADDFGVIIYSTKPQYLYKTIDELSKSDLSIIAQRKRYNNQTLESVEYIDYTEENKNILEVGGVITREFYDNEEFIRKIVLLKNINNSPFITILEIDKSVIVLPAKKIAGVLALLVILAILAIVISIIFFVKRILRLLYKFKKIAEDITNGKITEKIDIKSNDYEFKLLATAIQDMSISLRKSRENVEKQVKDQQNSILNILHDVKKERNKAETLASDLQKFKLAVDNVHEHIVITDKEGIVVYANKAMERTTGFTIEETMGKKAGVLWGRLMSTEYYKKMWQTLLIQKKSFVGDINNRKKSGEDYIASVSIYPVLDNKKNVIFIVGVEIDITREREIDKAKTEFVSLASHQLRTPLSAIGWYTEMLLAGDAGKINKEQKKYLEEVYHGNKNMVELVNSLLNVSRIELGTFMVQPEKADIIGIVKNVLKLHKTFIKEKKIKITTAFESGIPELKLDKKLLTMVFQNLINNAIKYNSVGGKIDIKILKNEKDVLIKISDNGLGIPLSQQDKIFTKLFRADNVRKMSADGTGLGLYMVKSILDNTGCSVFFKSQENKGSEFVVSIPLKGMESRAGTKKLS